MKDVQMCYIFLNVCCSRTREWVGNGVGMVERTDSVRVRECHVFGWVRGLEVRTAAFSFSKRKARKHRKRPAEVPFLPVMWHLGKSQTTGSTMELLPRELLVS